MNNSEEKIFNKIFWKESFNDRERLRTEQELKIGQVKKGKKVLDLRCGPGFKSKIVRERIGDEGELVCIDRNSFFIKKARKFCNYNNVKFIKGDIIDTLKLIKKNYGGSKRFDYIILSWIYSSPKENPKLIKDISKLLEKKGILIVSRGGDDLKDAFTKNFNRKINDNLYKIIRKEHLKENLPLRDFEINLEKGKIDIISSFKEVIDVIKNNGFRIKKEKDVIYKLDLEERLEFYKNPLRNRYIGKFFYKERCRLFEKAFRLTVKEIGRKRLSARRRYIAFEKNNS
jgi:SAM-dependent methyltransferase